MKYLSSLTLNVFTDFTTEDTTKYFQSYTHFDTVFVSSKLTYQIAHNIVGEKYFQRLLHDPVELTV